MIIVFVLLNIAGVNSVYIIWFLLRGFRYFTFRATFAACRSISIQMFFPRVDMYVCTYVLLHSSTRTSCFHHFNVFANLISAMLTSALASWVRGVSRSLMTPGNAGNLVMTMSMVEVVYCSLNELQLKISLPPLLVFCFFFFCFCSLPFFRAGGTNWWGWLNCFSSVSFLERWGLLSAIWNN